MQHRSQDPITYFLEKSLEKRLKKMKGTFTWVYKLVTHHFTFYMYSVKNYFLRTSKPILLVFFFFLIYFPPLHIKLQQFLLRSERSERAATFSGFNPLSPDINMHILLTVVHMFHMIPLGRICLNIKTFHFW